MPAVMLPPRHLLLALACALAWGGTFVVIRRGLDDLPPLLLATLRFGLVAMIAAFLPRPALPWRDWLGYALLWGVLQFGCLFAALAQGMPAGLSSVVAQSQVVFTLLFLVAGGEERFRWRHIAIIVLAASGIALLALDQEAPVPLTALLVALAGAAGWASGNLYARSFTAHGVRVDTLAFVAWSAVPIAACFALLTAVNGDFSALRTVPAPAWHALLLVVLYQALVAQLFGALAWNALLRRYPASVVAPYSLLVPIIGIALAWLVLDERPGPLQWIGSTLFLLALLCNGVARQRELSASVRREPA